MFFNRLWKALSLGVRMLKNILLRPFRAIYFQIQRSASLSRQAAQAAPKLAKSIAKVKLKPENRSDYIETRGAFIAKPLFIMIIVVIFAIAMLGYFIVWPWLESRFFVAHIPAMEEKAATHSGRVALYYDSDKTQLQYEGRLREGVRYGSSKEYYEDGILKYEGDMENGLYSGKGTLYDEEGKPLYEGSFAEGIYEGKGVLYEDGVRVYEGGFAAGLYEGQGTLYENGDTPTYEGGFLQGEKSGSARVYESGTLVYEGAYSEDAYNGSGRLYYPSGTLKAEGAFSGGRMTGQGIEYYENGRIRYQGMFNLGEYAGEGVLYHESGAMLYRGGFSLGQYEGEGTLYYENGKTLYKGGFSLGQYEGEGTLYYENGKTLYKGGFSLGVYEGSGISYREDGSKHIVASFEGGSPAGEVEIYGENGSLQYRGGYQNGLYQGEGALYDTPLRWIEGVFDQGVLGGTVKLYVNKALYYEGGYQDGAFNGAGKIYNPFGEPVFEGNFLSGVPDGVSLLGRGIEAVYSLFGEGRYTETYTDTGILITANDINLAVFLNYPVAEGEGTEPQESTVHRFYVFEPGLLSGHTLATLPLPKEGPKLAMSTRAVPEYEGVEALSGQRMLQGRFSTPDYYFSAWAETESGPVHAIELKSTVPLPIPDVIPVQDGADDGGDAGPDGAF